MKDLQTKEPEVLGQRILFDYAALDAETRIVVQQRAGEIKSIAKRMAADVVEIGEKLADVKPRLGVNDRFNDWLSAELGWSARTAHNFIGVWQRFGSANFAIENVAVSALYALAAPSTPVEAVEEVKRIADRGQKVTNTVAKEIIEKAKATRPKQAELAEAVDPSTICLCGCKAGDHVRNGRYLECTKCECEIFQEASAEEIVERNTVEKALGITPSKRTASGPASTPTPETIARLKAEMELEESDDREKASGEPSTEFFTRPAGWFNSPIEIRITLLPGGDAETRKIQYAVRDAAIQFRAAPLTAEDYGEDTLLRLLPDAAYKLVEQLAAEWGKNQWSDAAKKRLKAEAIARWRREPVETVNPDDEIEATLDDEQEDYQAKWLAGLSNEERERYDNARCSCGHCREWHDGAGGCCMGCLRGECDQFHCAACDTKGGHKANCKYYVVGEGGPITTDPPYQADCLDDEIEAPADEPTIEEAPRANPQINEFGVYVKGVEEVKIPLPKKAGKNQVVIRLVRDRADGMWRSSYSVRAGTGAASSPVMESDPCYESRELALGAAGEKARAYLLRTAERRDSSDSVKRQINAALPELDKWIIVNSADHSAAYPDDEIEAPADEPTIEQALHAALHHVASAAERWRVLREKGATDAELVEAVGREFGTFGGSSQHGGYRYKGGKSPRFSWPGYADMSRAQTLKGKRLLAKVREVLGIGAPARPDCPNCGCVVGKGHVCDPAKSPKPLVAPDRVCVCGHQAAAHAPFNSPDEPPQECTECECEEFLENDPAKDIAAGEDDFTAARCDECKRIDGAHSDTCSQRPNILTFEDYLAYAEFTKPKAPRSWARKWMLSREMDGPVHAWKLYWKELEGRGVTPVPQLCMCGHPQINHKAELGCMTLVDPNQSCQCVTFVASAKAEELKRAKKGRAAK